MRITAFHAADGDCVLLSTATTDAAGAPSEHHLLIDGGRATSFRDEARDTVYALGRIDVVCVSHIDDDHISGIVAMIEDAVAWRVHRFREAEGLPSTAPPFPEPPEIGEIWHNALFELVGDDLEPEVQPILATVAGLLMGAGDPALADLGRRFDRLATGERSAMELSRRISDRQLAIQRNRPADKPMLRRAPGSFLRVGPLTIRILGPTEDDLERLRASWRAWIERSSEALGKLQRELLDDEQRLGTLSAPIVASPLLGAALGDGVASVTEPNLASLMLLVQEKGGGRLLLTGDGISSEILDGLRHVGKLDAAGRIHVEVLKVQHHGALANVDEPFVAAVTADDYLFCGNGAHHNPELEVVEALALARLTGRAGGAPLGPATPFRFWFTSSARTPGLAADRRDHMAALETLVARVKADHDPAGRFSFTFIDRGAITLEA
jgi:hypothetical protein